LRQYLNLHLLLVSLDTQSQHHRILPIAARFDYYATQTNHMKDDSEAAAAARLVTGNIISPSGHFGVYPTLQQPNIKLSRYT
jgi:hypothetical protein